MTKRKLILASKSPRRQQLLQQMGYSFETRIKDCDESYPSNLKPQEIVKHICLNKANVFQEELLQNELLLTADTIVYINDRVLGKPKDRIEAIEMLELYSGKEHKVVTGVCVADKSKKNVEFCETTVFVRQLSKEEIIFYIDNYQPYDKAGGYGIQEWFGAVAVEKIIGSYNNVMGLPTHLVHKMIGLYEL